MLNLTVEQRKWLDEFYEKLEKCDELPKTAQITVNEHYEEFKKFSDEYTIIVIADHGGHDRTHGTTMDEDMTIPMFFIGDEFEGGKELENVSILDIAPTIAKIIGVPPATEWEGKVLFE